MYLIDGGFPAVTGGDVSLLWRALKHLMSSVHEFVVYYAVNVGLHSTICKKGYM